MRCTPRVTRSGPCTRSRTGPQVADSRCNSSAVKRRAIELGLAARTARDVADHRGGRRSCGAPARPDGRRGLRTDPAASDPGRAPPGLLEHPCLTAAALARRRADPARNPRRRHDDRHHDHADGRGPRHRARVAGPARADRRARDRRTAARPAGGARCRGHRGGDRAMPGRPARGRPGSRTKSPPMRRRSARRRPSSTGGNRRRKSTGRCARSIRGRSRRPAGRAISCASGRPRVSRPTAVANPVESSRPPTAGCSSPAGEGALQLHRVQLAGRRAMTSAEFLNAHPLAGARLGE